MRAINILSGISLAILLARGLGTAGYGQYIFALTLVHMLSLPIQLGLPTLLMRQVAIYRGQSDWAHLIGIIRWSVLFVSITLGAIALLVVGYNMLVSGASSQFEVTSALYLMAFLLAGILGYMQITSAMLSGFERVFWGSVPDGVIRPLLLLTFAFSIHLFGELSPSLTMGLHALAAFAALLWAVYIFQRHCIIEIDQQKFFFHTKTWLTSLLPLSFIAGAAIINSKLDLFMLGILSSKVDVGLYSVALQIAGAIIIGQTIVNSIIAPKIARIYANGDARKLQKLVTQACQISSIFAVLCLIIVLLFGQLLIETVFGLDFGTAYNTTLIVCVGFVFSAMVGPVVLTLNMTGHERTTARVIGFSAVMNAVLNVLLIPRYGAEGAAVATSITTIVIQAVLCLEVYKKTGLRCDIAASIL